MENSVEIPQKTKNRTPSDPAIPLLGIYLKKTKNTDLKNYVHPNIHSSIIYNSQDMEATWVSINRWMDEEDVIHTHTHTHTHAGILLSHKKEWNFAICNNMDGWTWRVLWNKSDREKVYVITSMWNLKR